MISRCMGVLIILLVVGAGCAPLPAAGGENQKPVATPGEGLQQDAAEYARVHGVSQAEALRRLELQGAIGALGEALEREQAATFGGLWIEHTPEFRVVAAFTRDGEQTLQPYLKDQPWADLVAVKTVPYTFQELRAAQEQVNQAAQALGISASSAVMVQENRVVVEVGNPALFEQELRAAGTALPAQVTVLAIDPQHLTDTLRGGVETYPQPGGGVIYFPRQAPSLAAMQALLESRLLLDANGCLRVGEEGGRSLLVIWRHDHSLRAAGEALEILNGAGRPVAQVGEAVRMGGGEVEAVDLPGMPIEACPGPYWVLGEIE